MEKIRSRDGTPIACYRSGVGASIVLVHGSLATHSRWGTVIPLLERQFTVYAIDRRGRGESGDAPVYALEREFEDVAAVADSIGGQVNLLGHSFGALCVLEAALLSPHVHSLVVYEPPPAPVPEGMIDRMQARLDAGDPEGAVIILLREMVRMPPDELEHFRSLPAFPARVKTVPTFLREYYAIEQYRFEFERFKGLNIPALLLLGGESPTFARTITEDWHNALPNSRIVELPGQRHIAMDTAPDLFVHEVQTFLDGTELSISN